jgi:lycopene cyclase-like protein
MHWVDGFAEALTHEEDATTVTLRSGQRLRARVVVDATGEGSLLERNEAPAAWQTAYGALLTIRGGHPWALDEIGLMDFRGEDELPTFLYAQPLSSDRVFVEETTLIRSPEVPISELRDRLFKRLSRMGIDIEDVADEEHCRIRMIGSRPVFGQRALGFGAAAGMVHPASGYQLARLPAAAEAVADALASNLSDGAPKASAEAWKALWPASRQRQWALYRFGAKILCELDAEDTRRFFDAFFKIDPSLWAGFLSATLSPLGLARAMAAVFSAASISTRRQLLSAGASPSGLDLLRTISRPTP